MHNQHTATPLERLLRYLETDPANPNLLADAAEAAAQEARWPVAESLLERLLALRPLDAAETHALGLSRLSQGKFSEAKSLFAELASVHHEPTLIYNLAYATAMLGDHVAALELLGTDVLASEHHGIALAMSCLHHLGRLDDAIALGVRYQDHPVVGSAVCAMLATLSFDVNDRGQAVRYAERHPNEAGALIVRGLIALEGDDPELTEACFAKALTQDPRSGRAHLGEGLRLFKLGHFDEAASHLDHAAAWLDQHAGSWLAAGWAHLLSRRPDAALERFIRASDIDRGFAEAVGGQAMAQFARGQFEEAERLAIMASRLDSSCLSAIKVKSLLARRDGDEARSQALEHLLLGQTPGGDGRTLAQLIATQAMSARPAHPH